MGSHSAMNTLHHHLLAIAMNTIIFQLMGFPQVIYMVIVYFVRLHWLWEKLVAYIGRSAGSGMITGNESL